MRDSWIEKCRPCKIGTIPKLLLVHGGDKIAVGKYVRVKYAEGGRWERYWSLRCTITGISRQTNDNVGLAGSALIENALALRGHDKCRVHQSLHKLFLSD